MGAAKPLMVVAIGAATGMKRVERNVVVRRCRAGRDRDVRHRRHRWRHRDVLVGDHAAGLQTSEARFQVQHAGLEIVLDDVGLFPVEGNHDDLGFGVVALVIVVVSPHV
jgi:hypothetical protein